MFSPSLRTRRKAFEPRRQETVTRMRFHFLAEAIEYLRAFVSIERSIDGRTSFYFLLLIVRGRFVIMKYLNCNEKEEEKRKRERKREGEKKNRLQII